MARLQKESGGIPEGWNLRNTCVVMTTPTGVVKITAQLKQVAVCRASFPRDYDARGNRLACATWRRS